MPDTPIDQSDHIPSIRLRVPTGTVPIPPAGFGQLHSPAPGVLALRLSDGSVVEVGPVAAGGGSAVVLGLNLFAFPTNVTPVDVTDEDFASEYVAVGFTATASPTPGYLVAADGRYLVSVWAMFDPHATDWGNATVEVQVSGNGNSGPVVTAYATIPPATVLAGALHGCSSVKETEYHAGDLLTFLAAVQAGAAPTVRDAFVSIARLGDLT